LEEIGYMDIGIGKLKMEIGKLSFYYLISKFHY